MLYTDPLSLWHKTPQAMAKQYTSDHVKTALNVVGGTGYVALVFNYGFSVLTESGKKYRPVKVNTGVTVDPTEWEVRKGEEQWFTPDYIRKNKRAYDASSKTINEARKKLFAAYEGLAEENPEREPTPEEILHRYRGGKETKKSAVLFTDYFKSYIEGIEDPRTKQKFNTSLTMWRAMEAARKEGLLGTKSETGPVYLHTLGRKDFEDLSRLIDLAGAEIPRPFTSRGVAGITLGGGAYTSTTKRKYQSDISVVINHARMNGETVNFDPSTVKKAQRHEDIHSYLRPDELKTWIEARMTNPGEENARRLFLVNLFSGCRYESLEDILGKEIRQVKGFDITFPAIYYVPGKTAHKGTRVLLPLLAPLLDILQGERPYIISNDKLNEHIQEIARKLGLDRIQHSVRINADKSIVESELPLHECLGSHSGRRSFYTGLISAPLFCSRQLVTQCTGHIIDKDDSADLLYLSTAKEDAGEALLQQIALRAHRLPYKILPDVVSAQIAEVNARAIAV